MIRNWNGKRVLIIGAARQGAALVRYLVSHGVEVVLNDRCTSDELADVRESLADVKIEWVLGGHPLSVLNDVDLVCPSGGVPLTIPLVVEAQKRGLQLANDSQIFLEAAPCRVVGITGSAGKTTTTTIVGRMAEVTAKTWVGGNIGNPLITKVDEMDPDDLAVAEFSSFQLELVTHSPQVAAVLNVTPNHLDRHGSMEAYTAAKANILSFQRPGDVAVLGRDDTRAWSLAESARGEIITFGLTHPPAGQMGVFPHQGWITLWDGESAKKLFPRELILLRGEHNLLNVLAACAIAAAAELPVEAMQAGVEGFEGVPHRLEYVRSWGGADWYNDSIATAPERAIAAMRSFDEPLVLLAGGKDKDLPWEDFAQLVRRRVDHLIIFGDASEKVIRAVDAAGPSERPYSISICARLHDAVDAAAQVVEPGDVVLLSPGGTSFDEFDDFAARGEWFRKWVNELA
ncbi:MAG: UDP-N-acetylmuramoyl-L-alanine--D-glutamate ligase [Chloroflexota bacterium]|nr:UDP-N-acetylmuramoyl-L-alanine--D-glutamate ligase [Chloroflexota bacterium]